MSTSVTVNAQATPNPNAVKFSLNRVVSPQAKTWRDAATADTAWAKQILAIPGVTQVFSINDFVSVSKAPGAAWDDIAPAVQQVLLQAFAE